MKSNSIEFVTQFDSSGEPLKWETFNTRPSLKLSLVYECVEFLSSSKSNPNYQELHQLLDLVVRIYDEQFTKSLLIDGLPLHNAIVNLYQQIIFVASGKTIDEKVTDKEIKQTTVNSWLDYKNNLKATIQDMVKEGGQDINNVLNMPFYFVFDELNGEAKRKEHKESMLDAFT
ncbi:hypothetical protein IR133_09950 [Staphylococcus saprophyticus]|uniref:phage tail assembly chaperone GT n=1 Tax=Staphylococcus TaxID=1279 RepID=UPI00057C14CA|nr:hypothetical protein [Staphylococcus shinii]MBF0814041.1 hypothetical protein [Staphylococcus saprophyticus]TFV23337.1 hypothetical protein E4T75_09955 [Staphylococcus saprophyticus]